MKPEDVRIGQRVRLSRVHPSHSRMVKDFLGEAGTVELEHNLTDSWGEVFVHFDKATTLWGGSWIKPRYLDLIEEAKG